MMDFAEVKSRRRTGNKTDGFIVKADDLNWLFAEIEALTAENTRIFAMVDAREQTIAELTALCDGYRGEVERLESELKNSTRRCAIAESVLKAGAEGLWELADYRDRNCMLESWLRDSIKSPVNIQSALTRARAEGMGEGLKAAAETVYSAICSYRSTVAHDEEGSGLELSDVLAHGYGDSDIGRAKGELALLSDHIYCEIMNHEITSAEACRLAEQADKGENK